MRETIDVPDMPGCFRRMEMPVIRMRPVLAVLVLTAISACGDTASPTATLTPTSAPTARATAAPTTTAPTATVGSAEPSTAPATAQPPADVPGTCVHAFPDGLTAGTAVDDKFVCIDDPAPDAEIAGGAGSTAHVSGWVAGAFEQNVVIELRDADGQTLARAPTTAAGGDIGLYAAHWAIDLELDEAATAATGVMHAFTTSPRDGSVDTEASIPVRFAR